MNNVFLVKLDMWKRLLKGKKLEVMEAVCRRTRED